jgi:hypothetical protein
MSGIMLGTFTGKVYHPVTDGLVLQYSMSDYSGSGTSLPDSSGNSRTATIVGSPSHTGNYFTFDGTNDYFITPAIATALSGDTHSTECWIYPTNNGIIVTYVGQTNPFTNYHHSAIEIVSGNLEFGLWNGSGITSTGATSAISNNAWHQVVLTYDGTTCRGYLDGSLAGSVAVSWDSPHDGLGAEGTDFHMAFGAADITNQGDGTYYNGRMGLQRIYNRALSAEEIVNNFNATRLYYTS